ncbi:MAG: ATP-dependent RecD-like DNA helicase, partial [Bacilli bacterium]|nr:ATP-dependent RecD-like DNA helicase [Bacilli bacterium]
KNKEIAKYKAKLFTNLLAVTCNFDRKPLIDEEYEFSGVFVTNQYGTQFKAESFLRRNEKTLEGVIAYLSSDFFPGIGRVAATRVFESLGKDCLNLIERNPEVIDQVPGLSEKQKNVLKTNIFDLEHNKRILVNILDLGITMRTASKLVKALGDNAYSIIEENPYQLIDLVEGFGFKRADRIALGLGIEKNSEIRLRALTLYIIRESCYASGNVYLEYDELFEKLKNETNNEQEIFFLEDFEKIIKKLTVERKIILDKEKNIYLYQLYFSENALAQKVRVILNREINNGYNINDINKIINKTSEHDDIVYSQKQREAIVSALQEPILIITGGPGTGKSTIIKAIINCLLELSPSELISEKLALLAPTGRAAKRLNEISNFPAQTIHRFLGYEGQGIFKFGLEAKTDAKIVIVDEFSMVDLNLAARLFLSLEEDVKIIIVGDVDQLPSVEPGEVLSNLISSKEIKTIRLDRIHRQLSESTIISLAHAVNQGVVEENIMEKQNDRNFIRLPDNNIIPGLLKTVEQAIASGMDLIKDIQVLVPLYKGEIGINAINERMQETFNPGDGRQIKHLNRIFRVNDKVIQLVNRSEKKVMNGDIGHILTLNMEDGEYSGLTVLFDFGPVDYNLDELEDLTHAYAISIHKSQGSEYELVIMPFSYKYYIMLKRKLIYTGITRARRYLIMLGNLEAFVHGISGIETKRKTKLAEKIQNIDSELEELSDSDYLENLSPYDFLD